MRLPIDQKTPVKEQWARVIHAIQNIQKKALIKSSVSKDPKHRLEVHRDDHRHLVG